jgi:hypothetical protein
LRPLWPPTLDLAHGAPIVLELSTPNLPVASAMANANDSANVNANATLPAETPERRALVMVFGQDFTDHFTHAVLLLPAQVLACPVVVRMFKQRFRFGSRQFLREFLLRYTPGFEQQLLDDFQAAMARRHERSQANLSGHIHHLQKLLDAARQVQGLALATPMWPNPTVLDVPIIAPGARRFFELLLALDRLHQLTGACGLLGLIDSAERVRIERSARKSLKDYCATLERHAAVLHKEYLRAQAAGRGGALAPQVQAESLEAGADERCDAEGEAEREHGGERESLGELGGHLSPASPQPPALEGDRARRPHGACEVADLSA